MVYETIIDYFRINWTNCKIFNFSWFKSRRKSVGKIDIFPYLIQTCTRACTYKMQNWSYVYLLHGGAIRNPHFLCSFIALLLCGIACISFVHEVHDITGYMANIYLVAFVVAPTQHPWQSEFSICFLFALSNTFFLQMALQTNCVVPVIVQMYQDLNAI